MQTTTASQRAAPCGDVAPQRGDLATLTALVGDVIKSQREHEAALRRLESIAGAGPWAKDLDVAMQKADASRFWGNEAIEHLQRAKGHNLVPESLR